MKLRPKTTISSHFGDLEDPRVDRTKRHQLIDIITITMGSRKLLALGTRRAI